MLMKVVVNSRLTSDTLICSQPKSLPDPSRVRNHRPRHRSGFTLIELLTVLVIVGILVSVIVLNQTGADKSRKLRAEAERLMLAIEQARLETTMRNEIWAIHTTRETYGFTRFNEVEEWEANS